MVNRDDELPTDRLPVSALLAEEPRPDAAGDLRLTMLSNLLDPDAARERLDVPLAVPPDNPSTARTTEIPRLPGPPPERLADEPPAAARACADAVADTTEIRLLEDEDVDGGRGLVDDTGGDDYGEHDTTRPRARGTRRDGTVRTTGWLQLGRWPVSSGWWALLGGLAAGLVLSGLTPWAVPALALAGWVCWRVATRWVWPSSTAVNVDRVPAEDLEPGTEVRLFGPIGPVGVVDQVTPTRYDQVLVRFTGGTQRFLPTGTGCHVVELRD